MPTTLTVFAATLLVFIEAVVALGAVAWALLRRPRVAMLRWLLAAGITGAIAGALALIGGALYNDPRPFVGSHVKPLIAHAADNGFPSDHALLAAFLVACVLLARAWFAVPPVAVLGVLVDWARVGAGIHRPIDVLGSTVFVIIGAAIALVVAPILTAWLAPRLPRVLFGPEPVAVRERASRNSET